MSHHGSWGRSCYDRTGYCSTAKLPTEGKSGSRPDCTDDLYTPCRGRSNSGHRIYFRPKPVVTSALRCLVGKFEAMDALSLPIQDLTLQPAPLHSALNSPTKRGRTRDSSQRRLSPILSPTNTNLSKHDGVFIDEYMGDNTWGDTPTSTISTILRSSKKQFQSRRLRTPQYPVKATKTPSRSVNPTTPSRSISKHRNTTKDEVATYLPLKNSLNKKIGSMIKDRIKFFDGNPDENHISSPPKLSLPKTDPSKPTSQYDGYRHNIELSPPSYTRGAETPISKAPVGGLPNFSTISEPAREKSTFSSLAKSQYSKSRKQRKVFGEAVQNPFLNSQGSSEKTRSSITISPHTSPTRPQPFCRIDAENKTDLSPRGRSLARYEVNTTPTRSSELPKISRPRGRTIPGRKDPKTGIQKGVETRRNQISEKIEAIYQTKNEERKAQIQEKIFPEANYETSPMPKNDDDVRRPQRIKDTTSFRSNSKVADMRMRFDGGASFASTVLPGSSSKDAERKVSPVKEVGISSTIPSPPPVLPPPIFSSSIHKNINNSPKHPISTPHARSIKQPTPRTQTPSKSLVQRVSTLPLERREKTPASGDQQTPQKNGVDKKPTSSMKRLFEKPALQTWPRSIQRPKQVRNGLIADKLRIFEDILKKNDGIVASPGREMKRGVEKGMDGGEGKSGGVRSLVEGRKECFELEVGRDGDTSGGGGGYGNGNERKLNPVFPNAVVAKERWNERWKGKGKGKEMEIEKKDKICEERNMGGDGVEVEVEGFNVSPTIKEKVEEKEKEKVESKWSTGGKGPRLGSRRFVVGRWNEISSPLKGTVSIDNHEELVHLPVKRGLRDVRMHTGRDGSHSIDWDEVEREIKREGGLDLGVLDLEVLVGMGKGVGKGGKEEVRDGMGRAGVRGKEGCDLILSMGTGIGMGVGLNMVVKEAECGLKEPKPLRAAEIKRMVEICRDRDRDRMGEKVSEKVGLDIGGRTGKRERSRGRKLERRK